MDLLVIDEVYKLQHLPDNDRVLVLNVAYYKLVQKSTKHILLAPFIGGISNIDKLPHKPKFSRTDYSPVVNKVTTYNITQDDDDLRHLMAVEIVKKMRRDESRIIYFPTVTGLSSFCSNKHLDNYNESQGFIAAFVAWIKKEFHKDWYVVKALESGLLVHNGQIPSGIRMYMLNLFNRKNTVFNTLLSTATLLEGVNTTAKHIVITKPSRTGGDTFDAFDFFNLVGRSGRLFEHYLGEAHYIKSSSDPEFIKDDAMKTIEFEITQETDDILIHTGNHEESFEYLEFLSKLNITHEKYLERVGSKFRLETVIDLHNRYSSNMVELLVLLEEMKENEALGRGRLVHLIETIISDKAKRINSFIINKLLNLRRVSISKIVDSTVEVFKISNIDYIINLTLRLKYSYIEHEFYSKILLIIFFLEQDTADRQLISIMEGKLKRNIDLLYYADSRTKRMLKDLGISERDIETIAEIIGEDIEDIFMLKNMLKNEDKLKKRLDFMSKFIIDNL